MMIANHGGALDNLVIKRSHRRRAWPDQFIVYDAMTFDYIQLGFHELVMMRLDV